MKKIKIASSDNQHELEVLIDAGVKFRFWRLGLNGKPMPFLARLALAFKAIFTGRVYVDMFETSHSEADELGVFLQFQQKPLTVTGTTNSVSTVFIPSSAPATITTGNSSVVVSDGHQDSADAECEGAQHSGVLAIAADEVNANGDSFSTEEFVSQFKKARENRHNEEPLFDFGTEIISISGEKIGVIEDFLIDGTYDILLENGEKENLKPDEILDAAERGDYKIVENGKEFFFENEPEESSPEAAEYTIDVMEELDDLMREEDSLDAGSVSAREQLLLAIDEEFTREDELSVDELMSLSTDASITERERILAQHAFIYKARLNAERLRLQELLERLESEESDI
jgi:hypothetical protein